MQCGRGQVHRWTTGRHHFSSPHPRSLQNAARRLGASSGLMGPGNSTGLNSPQPLTGRSGASPHQSSTPNAYVSAYRLKPWAVLFSYFVAFAASRASELAGYLDSMSPPVFQNEPARAIGLESGEGNGVTTWSRNGMKRVKSKTWS